MIRHAGTIEVPPSCSLCSASLFIPSQDVKNLDIIVKVATRHNGETPVNEILELALKMEEEEALEAMEEEGLAIKEITGDSELEELSREIDEIGIEQNTNNATSIAAIVLGILSLVAVCVSLGGTTWYMLKKFKAQKLTVQNLEFNPIPKESGPTVNPDD